MSASLPSPGVLVKSAQLAIEHDAPICLDYYNDSLEKKCCIGVQEDGTKFLVKSESEYTSNIQQVYKCESCYIIETENSLYIISTDIPIKKILSNPSGDAQRT